MKGPITNKFPISIVKIFCLLAFSSCEFNAEARLEGGNPPVFSVWSGSGKLWFFFISEYRPDKSLKSSERFRELWSVQATQDNSGNLLGKYTSEIDKISYGTVPEGYRQGRPATGSTPPLVEGKYYYYSFKTENGMPADGDFEIRGGQAVSVKRQHDCYYLEDGKEIDVPCGDSNDNTNP